LYLSPLQRATLHVPIEAYRLHTRYDSLHGHAGATDKIVQAADMGDNIEQNGDLAVVIMRRCFLKLWRNMHGDINGDVLSGKC
jgi:hypothetical protein